MKAKRILGIVLIVLCALVGLAILLGAVNGLLGGEWTFGWTVYRYDDTGFEIGSGTVPTNVLEAVDIDWIDGRVNVVVCDDFRPSVTETSGNDLTEDSRMRWHLDEEGKRLTIKYRKPSSFLGSGENKQKDLVVRIPARMFEGLNLLSVNAVSSEVTVEEIPFDTVKITSGSGAVFLCLHPLSKNVSVESKKGDVVLLSTDVPSLSIFYETKRGASPILDFFFEEKNGRLVSGDGYTFVDVATERGRLTVKRAK